VSVKTTSICVMDAAGTIIREGKAESSPEAISAFLAAADRHYVRVGLEAGPLCQWLYAGLAKAGFPVICIETRHAQAVLSARPNKTDRNDARGIAQMMRVGLYRSVHVKTLRSQKLRMLLTHRKLLQSKAIAIENDLRGTLRNFGLKVGMVGTVKFEARIKELVENLPDLAALVEPLLLVRRVLREQIVILHRRLLAIVRDDEVCRRLMTIPGVGPVVSLTYRATVDVPARFRKSKTVGAVFGLTCAKYQSGEIDWSGRISRCGDEMMRVMLYEAAQSMMRSKKWSWLKAWGMQIARRRGMKKAIVALARRLAVIMHRIWVDGTEFCWAREQAAAA
jgi:transposase